MKKKIKLASVALGAAISIAALTGGLTFNNSATASADEISPASTIVVDTPSMNADSFNTAVVMHYFGDETTSDTTYLHLGKDANPNNGYTTHYGYQYNVVAVPSVGSKSVDSYYKWTQAFVVNSGYTYSSDIVYFIHNTYSSDHPVSGGVFDDTISSSSYTTLTYSSTATSVYITCAYGGVCAETSLTELSSKATGATLTTNGVTFYMLAYNNKLMVKTSKSIGCRQYSTTDSNVGVFSYYAK